MSWWDDQGLTKPKTGSPVPGVTGWVYDADGNPRKVGSVAQPGFVYNSAGGIEPIDGTPNGEGETTNANGVSTPTTPANTTNTTAPTGTPEQKFRAIMKGKPSTPANLKAAEKELAAAGIKVLTNASGVAGKISFEDNGKTVIKDVIKAAGNGGQPDAEEWQWLGDEDGGASGHLNNGLAGLLGGGDDPFAYTNGSLLKPWTEEYKNPYGDAPKFEDYKPFVAPDAEKLKPYEAPAPYVAPTGDEVKANDPGYKFGLDEGRGALENSAAARRFLHTGSTLKDIIKYGTDYGTTKYDDAVARGQSIYSLNTSTGLAANQAGNSAIQTNNNNTLDRATKTYDYGYNQNLAKNVSNKAGYDTDVANSFAQFLQRYNQFNTNKKMQYDMLTGLAGLGA